MFVITTMAITRETFKKYSERNKNIVKNIYSKKRDLVCHTRKHLFNIRVHCFFQQWRNR